jgi:hypothetical protein
MITPMPPTAPTTLFTSDELRMLRHLRARYEQVQDFFSPRELARLRFWRWLYATGRLSA